MTMVNFVLDRRLNKGTYYLGLMAKQAMGRLLWFK